MSASALLDLEQIKAVERLLSETESGDAGVEWET